MKKGSDCLPMTGIQRDFSRNIRSTQGKKYYLKLERAGDPLKKEHTHV
jgi:hypothetical protein